MGLDRFIKVNLLCCPLLVGAGYLFYESLPVIVFLLGISYVFFVALLTFTWALSKLSLSLESD